jgi:KDO2-lipid IV(A) lauroyltransferase
MSSAPRVGAAPAARAVCAAALRSRVTGRLTDAAYAAGWSLVKAVPPGVSQRSFRWAADFTTRRDGAAIRQLRANYRRVLGENAAPEQLDELVAAGMRSYARYWNEAFRLPRIDRGMVRDRLLPNSVGLHHIDAALERGNGAILALPHQGNWDVSGLWVVDTYGPFTTVVERLKPESLYDRFVAYREGLGFEILPITGGERPAFDVLRERLRQNRIVCLVCDRDLSRSGIEVDLFGEPTRMPGGPAMLAATTGAPLLPVGCWFTPDGWGQRVSPPVAVPAGRLREQVPAMTQALADALAGEIADHPSDWHMLQKLWLADLTPRRPRAAAAARD